MKQIINIQEKFGAELHTRQMVERLAASLNATDSYLLDMSGVMQISRSAADELYNLTHGDMNVDLINVEPFVEKMLSAVASGKRARTRLSLSEKSLFGRKKQSAEKTNITAKARIQVSLSFISYTP